MTNRLHTQHNAAAVLATLLVACAPAVPSEPAPDAGAVQPQPSTDSTTIRPLRPCVPSSLGFAFRDDQSESLELWPSRTWEQGAWFHNRTMLEHQVRYVLAGPIWQTTAVTETYTWVDWDMGVQSLDRLGQPDVIEIRIISHTTSVEPPVFPHNPATESPYWTCSRPGAQDWRCRPTDDRNASATRWPAMLPNPAQIQGLLPQEPPTRGVLFLPADLLLDGMDGPQNGTARVRLGSSGPSVSQQPALLLSMTGNSPGLEVLDVMHDGAWTGHLLLERLAQPSPSMRGCWNIQASEQRTEEPPLGHWTVTRAAHLQHVSVPASIPRP